MNGINKRINNALVTYREEGPVALFSRTADFFLVKIGWFQDKLFLGKLVERRGNIAKLNGCKFDLSNPLIPTSAKSSFIQNTYERDERKIIRKYLNPNLPVVELGASLGVVSCVTNKILNNPKDHVVVEANPSLIPIIEKNKDLNNCQFSILNRASGYGASEATFYVNKKFLSGSSQRKTDKAISVPTITLKEICEKSGFKYFNLVCDIEGGEVDLVLNENSLLQEKVCQIVLEVHPSVSGREVVEEMLRRLYKAGFERIRTGMYSTVVLLENKKLRQMMIAK